MQSPVHGISEWLSLSSYFGVRDYFDTGSYRLWTRYMIRKIPIANTDRESRMSSITDG
jgi:hypothetical protein